MSRTAPPDTRRPCDRGPAYVAQWVRDELDRIETRNTLARLAKAQFETEC